MPGLHTIMGHKRNTPLTELDLSFTKHEDNFALKIITQTTDCCLAISYHEGYPFMEWKDNEIDIILEGIIYNRSDEEIQSHLKDIARSFRRGDEYKQQIKRFVESSDGDYIVQIFDNNLNAILVFNDYLGRLAPYYYCKDGLFVFSKEIKTILNFIPKIKFNKSALAEFLMFEYPLGNKTLFKEIFRLNASELIIVRKTQDKIQIELTSSTDFNFILQNPFSTRQESIDFLKDAFLEATKNRIKTAERNGYRIIADLSGGYDTRTVLAGLSKYTKNVDYYTFEYVRDESPWAKAVFENLGSPGAYHKLSFKNTLDTSNISSLVYRMDGLVNYITTSVCYKDSEYQKKNVPGKVMRFLGLGGEFIRHPFKIYYFSLLKLYEEGVYSRLSLDTACKIVKLDPNEYKENLKIYFDTYPEKTPEDQLKRLYYEYYHNFVGAAAEDRERLHFWTVQPLWSLEFIRAIFSRVPLDWVGFKYYVKFMHTLDPRLTMSPIYGSKINLNSIMNITIFEARHRINNFLYVFLKLRLPIVYKIFKSSQKQSKNAVNNFELTEEFQDIYNTLISASMLFDLTVIEENLFKNKGDSDRIMTLILYLKEIEIRFSEKIMDVSKQ